jgi:hypothetical protein
MSLIYEGKGIDMKVSGTLWVILILGAIGVYIFSKGKTKGCIDAAGNATATYPIFPCPSGSTSVQS